MWPHLTMLLKRFSTLLTFLAYFIGSYVFPSSVGASQDFILALFLFPLFMQFPDAYQMHISSLNILPVF